MSAIYNRAVIANAEATRLPLADGSVHMIATSPPYWGLRDYGTGKWEGGDEGCDHAVGRFTTPASAKQMSNSGSGNIQARGTCPKCGAVRVDGQLGAEPLHDCLAWARGDEPCGGCYVCNMRTWAAEMWRVLRDDGVMFLNLGDSYQSSNSPQVTQTKDVNTSRAGVDRRPPKVPCLKPKDLVGIPWRVALALQADGWYLRSDIIWSKPNPMPESVTDRPTKAHEYVFLLTKAARYYWDGEAVKEKNADPNRTIYGGGKQVFSDSFAQATGDRHRGFGNTGRPLAEYFGAGRNRRTVWTIATQPYSGAHFATWPAALVEPMVKAGTSERGVCPECGKPWELVTEREAGDNESFTRPKQTAGMSSRTSTLSLSGNGSAEWAKRGGKSTPLGWRPTCDHDADPVPAVVLDPFAGSGTTVMVARQLGRIGLGFDLSEKYLKECASPRLGLDAVHEWHNGKVDANDYEATLPLWGAS